MGQLYSTGPAWFYVGIPISWNAVISFIQSIQQNQLATQQQQQQQVILSGGPTAGISYQPPLPPGNIVNIGPPPPPANFYQIFIQALATSFVPVFLGTAKEPPTIEIVPSWDEVETDAGGTEQPSERLSEGEEGIIAVDFTRFNEGVYLALAGRSQPNSFLGGFPGWGQVGKAMNLEGLTLPLWVVFPYSQKPVYGLGGLVPGYRFYNTLVEGPDRLRSLGTPARVTSLQFRAQRVLQLVEDLSLLQQVYANYPEIPNPTPILPVGPVDSAQTDNSVGGLYDFDMSGLPNPD